VFEPSHVERLLRHLVRFGSSRADAEDLAQETLVIAWRKHGELDRDRSLDAWLYGIARNVYRNHARAVRRRVEEVPLPDERDAVVDASDLASSLALREALQALPESQQDLVILHELEEYTLKETAAMLAIPFDTAKDRLRRAREVLRARMHVDLTVASASERRAATGIAKAAAAAVLAAVLAALPRAALAGTGGEVGTTSAARSGASKLALAGAVSAGIAIGVAADRLIASEPFGASPRHEVAAAPAPVETSPLPADAGVGAIAAVITGASTPGDVRQASTSTPGLPVAGANSEADLIERARRALRSGRAAGAVRGLMTHERRFPDGQLAEERDILLIEAYLANGDRRLAGERLAHYRRSYPSGLHRQRAADAARELESP
jgi:RNA polymerase sigma-70 factor (ECF subfamily)